MQGVEGSLLVERSHAEPQGRLTARHGVKVVLRNGLQIGKVSRLQRLPELRSRAAAIKLLVSALPDRRQKANDLLDGSLHAEKRRRSLNGSDQASGFRLGQLQVGVSVFGFEQRLQ